MVVQAADEQLIHAVAAGDMQALEALYDRYERAVYSFALQALGDQADAEQAAMESFGRVWQLASGYHAGRGRFALWLYHLAQAAVAENWRLRRRRDPQSSGDASAVTLLSRQLRRALAALPPELVQVVELAYFRGYTQVEIADRVAIPLGTVRVRLTEAFDRLRNSLARSEPAAPGEGHHDLDAGLATVYSLNLLPAFAARQFEAHLADCEGCRAEFAGFQAVGEILFHAVPLSEPDPGLKARVLEQVEVTALEAPPHAAFPLARPAVTGLPEPVPQRAPAAATEAETAAASAGPTAAESPGPRWTPASSALPPVDLAPETASLRPSGRRPRPVRTLDATAPGGQVSPSFVYTDDEDYAEPPFAAPAPASPRPAPAPASPRPEASQASPRPETAPASPRPEAAREAAPRSFSAPAPQTPGQRLPSRELEISDGHPGFRPAPLRAPVDNPVAPHLALPPASPPVRLPAGTGASYGAGLARDPHAPPEPALPTEQRSLHRPEEPGRAATPGRSDRLVTVERAGPATVAVARPRRQLDPEVVGRRQAVIGGLELGPAALLADATGWPEAMPGEAAGLSHFPRLTSMLAFALGALLCFLVALAAAMVYSSVHLWSRVGDLEATATSRDLSLQRAEAELARTRQSIAATPQVGVQVISLTPPASGAPAALGQAILLSKPGDRHMEIQVIGLPALKAGDMYQVWVTKKGGAATNIDALQVDARGRGTLVTAYYAPDEYQELFITRESTPGAREAQPGSRVLQGTFP